MPSNEIFLKKTWLGKSSKGKKISFAEETAKFKNFIPGPGKLEHDNWATMRLVGGRQSKAERVTEAAAIFKKNIKDNYPGPGKYNG